MATHSTVPAWRIPWTEEPGGLQSVRSQRVRRCASVRHTTQVAEDCSDWAEVIREWEELGDRG